VSNSEDLDALDRYFRDHASSPGAAASYAAWRSWFDGLGWFDKTLSTDIVDQAKAKRDALNVAMNMPDLIALGYQPADKAPPIDVAKEFAGGGKPPVIKKGDRGAAVRKLQEAIGVSPADGNFGAGTDAALRKWQAAHGLTADGIAGPGTWAAINVKTVSDITPPPADLNIPPVPQGTSVADSFAVPPAPATVATHFAPAAKPVPIAVRPATVKAPAVTDAGIFSGLSNMSTPVKVGLGLATAAAVAAGLMQENKKRKGK
jgi:peptidoglycan hydrolase-like protein with peptidoglycan-binding domain